VAILDAGAKDGLKSGMEVVRADRSTPIHMKVLFTEADSSVVRLSNPDRSPLPESSPAPIAMESFLRPEPVAVGEKVSSRLPKSRRGY
jgi:hypothetical protein